MYQQSQFDPALLSLMSVAKKVTPQGQPTVAAGIMQQAGVPPQAMQPGPPQGMMPPPPQGMPPPQQGLPGVLQQAQQAAPSVAQNMQEQQTAQMLAQAQPQPPMMAEGGIASLPVDDYEYADGGIIGYAGGGTSDVGDEGSIIRRLIDWMKSSKQEESEPEPQPMVPMIPNRGIEQVAPRPEPRPELRQAAPREGIASALPAPDTSESLYREQMKLQDKAENEVTKARTQEEVRQQKLADRRARGLSEDPNAMALEHLKETAAIQKQIRDAQLAKEGPDRQDALLRGIFKPGAMHLGQMLGNTAQEIMGVEATQRGDVVARSKEDLLKKQAEQAIRAAIQKAEYAELDDDTATAAAEREKAARISEALRTGKLGLLKERGQQLATQEEGERGRKATAANYGRSNELFDRAYQVKLAELAQSGRSINDPAVRREALEYAFGQTKGTTSREGISEADRAVKIEALKAKDKGYALASTMYAIEQDPAKKAAHLATMQNIEARYGLSQGGAGSPSRIMSMADVQATAAKSGKSVEEVVQAAKARGYTIQ